MFNNIFNLGNNNILGIDIGLSSIKAVELISSGGGVFLKDYKELYLARSVGKDVGDIVYMGTYDTARLIKQLIGDNIYDEIYIGYPANQYVVLTLMLPLESDGLEDHIIPIETKRYFNFFDLSNYDIKYEKLPDNILNNNKLNYVVILSKKRDILQLSSLLKENNIKIQDIEPNSIGSVRVLSGIEDEVVIDMGSA
ncbi:MAG: hypothetical protein QM532_01005 [Cyanobium sp. MAG06]|nr:hypothetical protein [Cyanobium sp. MAG06]